MKPNCEMYISEFRIMEVSTVITYCLAWIYLSRDINFAPQFVVLNNSDRLRIYWRPSKAKKTKILEPRMAGMVGNFPE